MRRSVFEGQFAVGVRLVAETSGADIEEAVRAGDLVLSAAVFVDAVSGAQIPVEFEAAGEILGEHVLKELGRLDLGERLAGGLLALLKGGDALLKVGVSVIENHYTGEPSGEAGTMVVEVVRAGAFSTAARRFSSSAIRAS